MQGAIGRNPRGRNIPEYLHRDGSSKGQSSQQQEMNWKDQKSCSKLFGSFSLKDLGNARRKLKMKIFTTFVLKNRSNVQKKEESVEHKGGKWLKGEKRTGERRQ
jgi:hypothetical protein